MHCFASTLHDPAIAGRATLPLNARMPARPKRPAGPTAPRGSSIVPSSASPSTAHGMVLQRDRLHALLDARLPGAVWLHGPTGAGKTVLLRSWLQRDDTPSIWLTADERHRDPAALFAAITTAVAAHAAAHLPTFSPEHRDAPAAFARGFFARLDQALPAALSFVIDDVHHLVGATAPLLAVAIDAFGARRNLCFASQLMPDAVFAPHLAGSRLWIVGHRLLAFDRDEARALATRFGTPEPMLDSLVGATDGWAAGLMLAMQMGSSGGSGEGSGDPLESVRTPLALLIAGQVIGDASHDDLRRLRLMAELPQIPIELADADAGWRSACTRLQGLAERGLFVERLSADRKSLDAAGSKVSRLSKGCWRLHDLFRNALREPGTIGDPDRALGAQLVDHLLDIERLDLAWQLAARLGAEHLSVVIASHGSAALRDPQRVTLLQMAAPHADRGTPAIAIWQARGQIGNDHAAALAACEEAFAGFEATRDADGAALAIALALFVVFATIDRVGDVALWSERFARVDRASVAGEASGERAALRIGGEVVHDLLIGGRDAPSLSGSAAQDRLMAHVSAEILSANDPRKPPFDLFQRTALCFRHDLQGKEQLDGHHRCEERKCACAGLFGCHREKPAHSGRHKPVSKAAERLALCANGVWEYFRNEHPDHRSLAEGVRRLKGDQTREHHSAAFVIKMTGAPVKSPSYCAKTGDVSVRSPDDQFSPASEIDQDHANDCEYQISPPDHNTLKERRIFAGPCHFKDPGRVIHQRVNSGQLVERRDRPRQEDRHEVTFLKQLLRGAFSGK